MIANSWYKSGQENIMAQNKTKIKNNEIVGGFVFEKNEIKNHTYT